MHYRAISLQSGLRHAWLATLFLAAPAFSAQAREASCQVHSGGELVVDNACQFTPDGRNGSFSVSQQDGDLFDGIASVSVTIVSTGVAEVSGLTSQGINSRWGTARRSRKDPGCWTGTDFEVCVW